MKHIGLLDHFGETISLKSLMWPSWGLAWPQVLVGIMKHSATNNVMIPYIKPNASLIGLWKPQCGDEPTLHKYHYESLLLIIYTWDSIIIVIVHNNMVIANA